MRHLILIRGMPGSGKSTLAKKLEISFAAKHVETDMYWGCDYKFDITKLKEAHEWCQNITHEILKKDEIIIVSNTFTTKKELKPYFDMAKEFDIVPTVILCQNNYKNVHNVPEDVLQRMRDRFEYDIGEMYND